MALDLDFYQNLLEEEKTRLEKELSTVAHRNPDAPQDWEITPLNLNVESKDDDADQEEELENEVSQEISLESSLRDTNDALERIKHGSFGVCAVGKEEIDEERLKANPAARTCITHSEK